MNVCRRIDARPPRVPVDSGDVASVLAARSSCALVDAAMALAERATGAGFVSIFSLPGSLRPKLVGTACSRGQARADRAARNYEVHHGQDHNVSLLQGAGGNGTYFTVQNAPSIRSRGYRTDCYDRPGIAGRASLIRRSGSSGVAVNLYSAAEDGPIVEGVFDRAHAVLDLLLLAADRLIEASAELPQSSGEALATHLSVLHPELPPRERQVFRMTVQGLSAADIASALGIAETTVISHRKKAYARCGVSNLKQLLRRTPMF